jgi:hypothetical protein
VMERPNLGIDLNVKFGFVSGLNILKKHTTVWTLTQLAAIEYSYGISTGMDLADVADIMGAGTALSEDAEDGIGVSMQFAYNVAPIIGVSQTFLNMDIDVLIPNASYSEGATSAVMVISPYTSVTKKMGGRMNLGINVGAGIDMLTMSGTQTLGMVDYTYTFGVMAPGMKFGVDLGYMLSPELSLNFGAGYKLGLPPMSISYTINEEDASEYFTNLIDYLDYSELAMGGVSFRAGVNYTLSELPVNIFGFLDPMKKH